MPVTQREQRDLRAFEQLLDEHVAAEATGRKRRAGIHVLVRAADEDALPGGEAVGLQDAGCARERQASPRSRPLPRQHVLRERLRALDSRRGRARPEDRDAEATQRIRETGDQRDLGADDDEVDLERAREPEQALGVLGTDGMTVRERRDAGVARRRVQLLEERRLRELPRERMLTTARADDERLCTGRVYEPT